MKQQTKSLTITRKKYGAISLFSGMGGDALGMQQAGLQLKAYSEFVPTFQETHDANFPKCTLLGKDCKSDITKITDAEFKKYKGLDFLFAGFPCQSFSTGGKRKVDDPRNTMFREFVRAAKQTNAKVILGENVKGLLTKKTADGELYIDIIVKEFEKLGYEVIHKVFKCHLYGVPQKRERLIILGIKKRYVNKNFRLEFPPETTPDKSDFVGLQDIIRFSMDGTMKVTKDIFDFNTIPSECIITDMENEEEAHDPHPYLVMKRDIKNKSYGGKTFTTLFSFGKRDSPIHCEVVDIRKPTKTIICTYDHQPRFFVPIRNKHGDYLRMLLPDELKQIQSFPKDYIMKGNTKKQIVQIGNAVPPALIKQIVNHIIH